LALSEILAGSGCSSDFFASCDVHEMQTDKKTRRKAFAKIFGHKLLIFTNKPLTRNKFKS